jgi:hypothetical protein
LSLALAAAVTRFNNSGLKRTGTMRALACPFAILGRPTFLAFGWLNVSKLLNDGRSHGLSSGSDWVTVQNGHVAPGRFWIVGIVPPSVDPACRRMSMQLEYLYDAIPDRLSLKSLFHWNAFNVSRLSFM